MNRILLMLGLLALLGAASPARAQIDSREGIALDNEIADLRRQIQVLQNNLGSGSGSSSGSSFLGGRSQQAPSGGASDLTAGLVDRVTRLEDAVRQLNGRIDELANAQSRAQADLSKQISDLQFRLDNGGTGGAAPAAAQAAPQTTTSPPPGNLGTVPAKLVPPQTQAAPAPPRTPDAIYQEGNAALARRDYATAETRAREVLNSAKNTPRGYDAQLLLAQALAGEKKTVDSALAYGETYQRNKQGAHAQDSLLGLANAQQALGDSRSACVALDTLRAQFPTPRPDIAPRAAALRTQAGCR